MLEIEQKKTEVKTFTVPVDLTDLRNIYIKYGTEAVDGALTKIGNDLKRSIKSALKLDTGTIATKTLVEG